MDAYVISSRISKSGTNWLFLGLEGVEATGPDETVTIYRCKASEALPKGSRITDATLTPTGMEPETLPKRIGDTHATVVETVTCELSAESTVIEPYTIKTLDLAATSRRKATAPYARAAEDDALPDA